MLKKIRNPIAMVVALIMLFNCMPLSVLAENKAQTAETVEIESEPVPTPILQSTDSGSFSYTDLGNNTCAISGYIGSDTEVVIPESIDGLTVCAIADEAFYGQSALTSITIPESVTDIGYWAFEECTSLQTVNIPSKVTTLKNGLFSGCSSLSQVTLHNKITEIDSAVFQKCSSLTSISLPDSVASIGYKAFMNCSSLQNITLPAGITKIEKSTFAECSSLSSIIIPESVIAIESNAFTNCSSLTNVSLPSGLTEISDYLFSYCTQLSDVKIPTGVISIGAFAFNDCPLKSIDIPAGVINIGQGAFQGCDFTEVTLPKGITTISESAFNWCDSLQSIVIPTGVNAIEGYAFNACFALTEVTIPEGVTSIGEHAFYNCAKLEELTIPESVSEIGADAFKRTHTDFTLVVVENSVAYQYAVDNNMNYRLTTEPPGEELPEADVSVHLNGPTTVVVGNPVTWTLDANGEGGPYTYYFDVVEDDTEDILFRQDYSDDNSFTYTFEEAGTYALRFRVMEASGAKSKIFGEDITAVVINEESAFVYKQLEDGTCMITQYIGAETDVVVPGEIESMTVSTIGDEAFAEQSSITGIVLPNNICDIGYSAFSYCTSLQSINIPSNVTELKNMTFKGCESLQEIVIPDGVTAIGQGVFSGCSSLTSVVIPDSVLSIDYKAFYNCTSLESITLPSGITTIPTCFFYNCSSLKNLIIPSQVTTIESDAFSGCTSLAEVVVPASVTSIADDTFSYFATDLVLVCTEDSAAERYAIRHGTKYRYPDGDTIVPKEINIFIEGYFDCVKTGSSKTWNVMAEGGTAPYQFLFELRDEDGDIIQLWDFSEEDEWTYTFREAGTYELRVNVLDAEGYHSLYGLCPEIVVSDDAPLYPDYEYVIENGKCTITKFLDRKTVFDSTNHTIPAFIEGYPVTAIGEKAFGENLIRTLVLPPYLERLADSAFEGNRYFQKIVFQSGVKSIGKNAFKDCTDLAEIDLLTNLTYLGEGAFQNCSDLEAIYIPEGVTRIESNTFNGCTSLSYVSIPESVTEIGEYSFAYCSSLNYMIFPSNLQSIEAYAFYDASMNNYGGLPDSLESIGDYAFMSCYPLGRVTLKENLTSIGQYAFAESGAIEVMIFRDYASLDTVFSGCHMIEYVEFSEDVTMIPEKAFSDCQHIKTVSIDHGVISIGAEAFARCYALDNLMMPNSVKNIAPDAFLGLEKDIIIYCDINSYTAEYLLRNGFQLPPSMDHIGFCGGEDGGENLIWTLTSEGDLRIYGQGPMGFDSAHTPWYVYDIPIRSILIEEGVTTIRDYAFYHGDVIANEINLPDSLVSIGANAFVYCSSFTGIIRIPANVYAIGDNAFWYCGNIDGVLFEGDAPTSFGTNVFGGGSQDFVIYYPENGNGWTDSEAFDVETGYWNGYPLYGHDKVPEIPSGNGFSVTWNMSAISLSMGESYQFSGEITAENLLDKVHVAILKADNQYVGVDYYRKTSIGQNTFDLSEIPAITAGDVLSGLQVTNDQKELSFSSGSYFIKIWVTDIQGNSIGELTKMVTIEGGSKEPVVKLLPITQITSSTVKLEAKVLDDKGGNIVNYGFNLYDNETDDIWYAQYQLWSGDPYYKNVSYDPETRILSVILQDYPANRTAYVQAFAIYYEGETAYTGFSPDRVGFTTKNADISITSPVNYQVIGDDNQIQVTGVITSYSTNQTYGTPVIRVFDYQMTEVASLQGTLQQEQAFSASLDLSGYNAGRYYLTAEVPDDEGTIVSDTVAIDIPGRLTVNMMPVNEKLITSSTAVLEAYVPDTQGKEVVNYGFNLHWSENEPWYAQYHAWHGDSYYKDVHYDPVSGRISLTLQDYNPNSTSYVQAFAIYMEGDTMVTSFSDHMESFTTKAVDVTLQVSGTQTGYQFAVDVSNVPLSAVVEVKDEKVSVTEMSIIATNSNGTILQSMPVQSTGNTYKTNLDLSDFGPGVYYVHAEAAASDGRVSISERQKVTVAKPATSLKLVENYTGEELDLNETRVIGKYYWLVVEAKIDTDLSNIKSITWETTDSTGLSIDQWSDSQASFDKARPYRGQLNGKEIGDYTVTVTVTNYDGSVLTATLPVEVKSITTLVFIDYLTKKPIEGVSVQIDGVSEKTNQAGQVHLYNITESKYYTLSAIHTDYNYLLEPLLYLKANTGNTILMYDNDHDLYSVKMTASYYDEDSNKTVTSHNDADILNTSTTLNMSDDSIQFSISVVADETTGVKSYALIQEKKEVASSSDSIFENLKPDGFKQNAAITLRITYNTGAVKEYPLQLKVLKSGFDITRGISNTKFSIGKEIQFKFPDNMAPLGGQEIKLSLNNLPATVSFDGEKIQAAIGVKDLFKAGDDSKTKLQNSKSFKELQELIETANKGGISSALLSLKMDNLIHKYFDDSFFAGMKGKPNIVGTMEVDIASKRAKVDMLFSFTYGGSKDYPYTLGPVPMVFSINASIDLSAYAKLSSSFDGDSVEALLTEIMEELAGEIKLKANGKFGIGTGIGFVGANVTANGEIGIAGEIVFPTTYSTLKSTLNFYVRAKLLAFEYRWDFYNKEFLLAEGSITKQGTDSSVSLMNVSQIPEVEFTLADRSYLSNMTDWYEKPVGDDVYLFSDEEAEAASDVTMLMSSIYPDTQLQAVQTENNKVMVWLADDATRSSINRTKLVFSVYDEATSRWSTPQSVSDDSTLDSYPVLATDGQDVFVVWVSMGDVLENSMKLNDCVTEMEICAARFNTQTKTFQEIQKLTQNSVIDMMPRIVVKNGNAVVVWTSNDAGDIWGIEGTNTVYACTFSSGEWTLPTEVSEMDTAVMDLALGYLDDDAYLAYTCETDDNFSTTEDVRLELVHLDSNEVSEVGTPGNKATLRFTVINGIESLVWYENQGLMSLNADTTEPTCLVSAGEVSANYDIVATPDETVILYTATHEDYSEIYAITFDAATQTWNNHMRLTYLQDGFINDYVSFINDEGSIETVFTIEKDNIATMMHCRPKQISNISLDSIYYDYGSAEPGRMITVFAEVTNHGNTPVSQVHVALKQAEHVLSEQVIDVSIQSNSTAIIEWPLITPETAVMDEYQIVASLPEAVDVESDNNQVSVVFGYTDLSIEVSDFFNLDGRTLYIQVNNNSGYDSGATINIYKDGSEKELLNSMYIENIEKYSYVTQEYTILETSPSLYIEVVPKAIEFFTGNNTVQYGMNQLPETSANLVSLTSTEITLAITGVDECTVATAVYDAEGRMLTLGIQDVDVDAEEVIVSLKQYNQDQAAYVKVFFLSDTETWSPLSEAIQISL